MCLDITELKVIDSGFNHFNFLPAPSIKWNCTRGNIIANRYTSETTTCTKVQYFCTFFKAHKL